MYSHHFTVSLNGVYLFSGSFHGANKKVSAKRFADLQSALHAQNPEYLCILITEYTWTPGSGR